MGDDRGADEQQTRSGTPRSSSQRAGGPRQRAEPELAHQHHGRERRRPPAAPCDPGKLARDDERVAEREPVEQPERQRQGPRHAARARTMFCSAATTTADAAIIVERGDRFDAIAGWQEHDNAIAIACPSAAAAKQRRGRPGAAHRKQHAQQEQQVVAAVEQRAHAPRDELLQYLP